MEERDEDVSSSKAMSTINWEIKNKHSVLELGKKLDSRVKEGAMDVMQNNCEHSLVLLLNASGNRTAHYCVSCGKVEYTQNLTKGNKRPYKYGESVNFSENLCSNFLDIDNSLVVLAFERMVSDSAKSDTDLTISEFIKTIPESTLVSPESIQEILKDKEKVIE